MKTILHAKWIDDTNGNQYYTIEEWDYWSFDGEDWYDSEGFAVDTDYFATAAVIMHGGPLDGLIYS